MIRPASPDDDAFILSGWSASYRMSRDLPFVQMDAYADFMHPVIRSVLARPRTQTLVEAGEVQHGFISFEPSQLGAPTQVHYVYVAKPYRRRGCASDLFHAAGIDPNGPFEYASRTRASWELQVLHKKTPLARFNPLRSRFAEEERKSA